MPGLDGRKMSKSYDNYIPLFVPAPKLKKLVRRIPTDCTPVEAPKDPDSSAVFHILAQFAEPGRPGGGPQTAQRGRPRVGRHEGQGLRVLDAELAGSRERYRELMDAGASSTRSWPAAPRGPATGRGR